MLDYSGKLNDRLYLFVFFYFLFLGLETFVLFFYANWLRSVLSFWYSSLRNILSWRISTTQLFIFWSYAISQTSHTFINLMKDAMFLSAWSTVMATWLLRNDCYVITRNAHYNNVTKLRWSSEPDWCYWWHTLIGVNGCALWLFGQW